MMLDLKGRQLMKTVTQLSEKPRGDLMVPTDLKREGVAEISESLNLLLADVFALYLKTKSFHWHISGPHFREYHLLLDEQAAQIFAMSDDIAERTRKIGGSTLRSISDVSRHQRLRDNDDTSLRATDMLAELCSDNRQLTGFLRLAHEVCDRNDDVATASLLENWIDETERRTWFLSAALNES
jgi:starvation-inducible DNA-binding protein